VKPLRQGSRWPGAGIGQRSIRSSDTLSTVTRPPPLRAAAGAACEAPTALCFAVNERNSPRAASRCRSPPTSRKTNSLGPSPTRRLPPSGIAKRVFKSNDEARSANDPVSSDRTPKEPWSPVSPPPLSRAKSCPARARSTPSVVRPHRKVSSSSPNASPSTTTRPTARSPQRTPRGAAVSREGT